MESTQQPAKPDAVFQTTGLVYIKMASLSLPHVDRNRQLERKHISLIT